MPLVVRATTTTNAHSRKQCHVLPPTNKSNELHADYLQVLKLIERTHRQQDINPTTVEKTSRRSNEIKHKRSQPFYQLSSSLTSVGQEAMVKTYEDTLISHLTNIYASKHIGAALPRLQTATFRHRLPIINSSNRTHVTNINRAQHIIDNIINNDSQKDEMLCDYVKWQQKWTKSFL
ncbi:unnamed protein product [Rotaria magnacalcarata]|uniref:Uncharacterized protein n=1 Tax=Rotaria magnacalcarata TaxID=392030 RepID=A0A819SQU8_9BILA|nr:unnamed protein product [Rotaria magnacalcarata]CAF4066725.1 unnamed protein product [Rotaria magnacalcarata]